MDFLGVSKKDTPTFPPGGDETFHDWHAHLFYLNRHKHVIFTHSASLFSVVAFNVFKKDAIDLDAFFSKNLARCLYYEEFSADEISRIVNAVQKIKLSLTSDRRVIGSVNDLIKQYKANVLWHEPSEEELPEFQRRLNQTPMSLLKMKYPIERFREGLFQVR